MKQLLQNLRTGETIVAEVPVPAPRPGTALVKTASSLVSAGTERMLADFAAKSLIGKARSRPDLLRQALDKARREGIVSTLEAAFNRLDQPLALGYSSAGMIVELGTNLDGFQVGQRVACAGGGYAVHAEYAVVPQNLIVPLPPGVDFDSAAFTTIGAIAMHGFRLARPGIGERVAVIGLGLLGLLAAGIARAAGCHVLGIDLDPNRLDLGKLMGVEQAALRDAAESSAQGFSKGRGCDVILICADTPSPDPVHLAGELARDRARVVAIGVVGLELPRKVYYEKELSFVNSRSYGPGRYDPNYEEAGQDYPIGYVRWTEGRNLEAFVDLLAMGKIDVNPLITHRIPIEEATTAYDLITGKRPDEPYLGVLLTYHSPEPSTARVMPVGGPVVQTSQPPAASSSSGSTRCRIGFIGAGEFARSIMLPTFRKVGGVELVGIASASGLSAASVARKFGFRYASTDASKLFRDPNINTVGILTRHNLHAQLIVSGLKAGKHVFCEKPIAITVDELDQIEEALKEIREKKSGIMLFVGFNRRFSEFGVRLKQFFDDRQEPLVASYRINAGYLPLSHWLHDPEQGGGRIIGEACHFIDFLTFLVGSNPTSVSAFALPDNGRYQRDNVNLVFSFPDGSLGTLEYLANGDKAFPKERIEVFSGGRVGVIDDFRSMEIVHGGKRKFFRSRLRQDKGHQAECEAFVNTILQNGPPPISFDQLVGVARSTFAAVTALKNRETIPIEPCPSYKG